MSKGSLNVSLKGADDIFSTEESRQEQQREQVQQIPIGELFPFKDHPFKVLDDESMQRTVESVEQYGVLSPLIARPRPEGGYEIISGHRRQHAAQLAGLDTLPVIVRNMDDDAAVLLMVDSNLQRENILPSERAFAYKMKLEALKNQGARSDLTSPQVAAKFRSDDVVAKDQGISGDTVRRYIRLTSLMSSIPLGENLIPIQRGLTTSSTAIFIPFITQELFQRGAALYYGLNALSNNMILCDRKQLKNPNGLILGTPGSGKSFAAKREMTNAFLITDDDIIICDPEAEYFSLVQRLGGQVIRLSPAGKGMDGKPQYVNPMDINLNYSEDDNPLALKSDFILSLCELVIGGKEGLQPVEKTVIDRAVRNVYRPFLADPDPAKMPILGDLYNELLKQPEPEAARIAAALELYVSGSLNVFNHRTNVELSNRLVCFDIKQLGKQLKKLGMLIVQDQVWNRVTVNRAEKKATRYYMDEFHLLLKEEQTAAYSVEIWKRFRKWGGIPTAITQNVKDLLSSREVENIFENSDFVLMLNQAQGDRAILAKQLNISPQQMKYVTHTEAGEGLIFYGNVVLPFIDRFPTDTELYCLLTTKPEEVSKP